MALSGNPVVLGNNPNRPAGAVNPVGSIGASTDNALVRWDGTTGTLIQNGIVTEADDTGTLTGPTYIGTTTAVGSAFTNQPANDGVEVVSGNAADTTQTVTIIGTTNGSDTVVVETVTLNGTTAVPTVKTDWGIILAVKKSAVTAGTVTVREASGDATITAGLTAAVLSVGVTTVAAADQLAYARVLSIVASGASTKQIGIQGTNTSDAVIYDSQALNGTTAVRSNSAFRTITEIYRGDLGGATTATVTTDGKWVLTNLAMSQFSDGNFTPGSGNATLGYAAGAALDFSETGGGANTLIGARAGTAITTGDVNVAVGFSALDHLTMGTQNTAVGTAAGAAMVGNSASTLIGYHSGVTLSGGSNTLVGAFAGGGPTGGGALSNTGVGDHALFALTSGTSNAGVGLDSLAAVTTGSTNTALGMRSGTALVTGSGNVFLGYFAGAYATGSDEFYLDNQNRTNTAGDKAGALFYGTFNATPASQTLKINAGVTISTLAGVGTRTVVVDANGVLSAP